MPRSATLSCKASAEQNGLFGSSLLFYKVIKCFNDFSQHHRLLKRPVFLCFPLREQIG